MGQFILHLDKENNKTWTSLLKDPKKKILRGLHQNKLR